MKPIRRLLPDLALGSLGVLFGLGSLTYPFGRDQGLYYYVAREWVLRGSVPYRDVLDHKTPGIYLLHALSILLFGEQQWGIRVFDLLGAVGIGVVAGTLTAARGEPVRRGVRGAAVLAMCVLFWGYLDFWNTAQSELWYALLGITSVAAAVRLEKLGRAAVVAGLFAGSAMLMKPPAIWLVLVAVVWIAIRAFAATGRGATLLARAFAVLKPLIVFGAGAAAIPAVVLSYFGIKGALPAMLDIVVGANAFYVKHERGTSPKRGFIDFHQVFSPLVPVLLAYLLVALLLAGRARDRAALARLGTAAAITAATYAAVVMQGKYYLLHWAVVLPAIAVIAANAVRAAMDAASARRLGWVAPPLLMTALGVLYVLTLQFQGGPRMWLESTQHAWRWTTGTESRLTFTEHFQSPGIGFWYASSELTGTWLRDHTTPEDLVLVRGFQPEIYAVAHRRYGGRFFWTPFLVNASRAYRRAEWLQEDHDAILACRPKYVVVLTGVPDGPDSAAYFEPLGYRVAVVKYELTVMERVAPATPGG